jgi:uncharacterized protein YcbK (DUF882 family)/LysM repeat protein
MPPSFVVPPRRPLLGLALLLLLTGLLCRTGAAAASEPREITHVVRQGQYLNLIAKRYHTTAEAIRVHNHLSPGARLKPGTTLYIVETPERRRWREHYERLHPSQATRPDDGAGKEDGKKVTARRAGRPEAPERRGHEGDRDAQTDGGAPGRDAAARKAHGRKGTAADPYARRPARPGYVTVVRYSEHFAGPLVGRNGAVVAKSASKVDRLLRSLHTGDEHPIDRRLLKLVAKLSDHFGGRTIVVVSGYRPYSPRQHTRKSRHNDGHAIDLRVVGVPDRVVFEHCLSYAKVGCGFYPTSHFVHLDVRDHKTSWTDYSRPGQPPLYAHRRYALANRAPVRSADEDEPNLEEDEPPAPPAATPGVAPVPPLPTTPAALPPVTPTTPPPATPAAQRPVTPAARPGAAGRADTPAPLPSAAPPRKK